jgi:hypothetical protein
MSVGKCKRESGRFSGEDMGVIPKREGEIHLLLTPTGKARKDFNTFSPL